MSMSGGFSDDEDELMNEINMTPLVDVMLVLLIIFLVTIPVMSHAVKVELPQAVAQPTEVKPPHVDVSVLANGQVMWDQVPVDATALAEHARTAAAQTPMPRLRLRADRNVRYDSVAQVMATAQAAGLGQIDFVTDEPPPAAKP
ncbi:MAG: ExbD/TolR family protein [Janthinobacterium lividum]